MYCTTHKAAAAASLVSVLIILEWCQAVFGVIIIIIHVITTIIEQTFVIRKLRNLTYKYFMMFDWKQGLANKCTITVICTLSPLELYITTFFFLNY